MTKQELIDTLQSIAIPEQLTHRVQVEIEGQYYRLQDIVEAAYAYGITETDE